METKDGNSSEQLEEQSDLELLNALVQIDRSRAKLELLLKERVLTYLSKVRGFPQGELSEDAVTFDLTEEGAVVVNVPVHKLEHQDALNLKDRFEQLPGVTADPAGSMNTGMCFLRVMARFNQESMPDLPPAVSSVREGVGGSLQGM